MGSHYMQNADREFLVRVSYMEIYNEIIRDLLNPGQQENLKIHEDLERGVFVGNLTETVVSSGRKILRHMENGQSMDLT
jgi:centromeric protein E